MIAVNSSAPVVESPEVMLQYVVCSRDEDNASDAVNFYYKGIREKALFVFSKLVEYSLEAVTKEDMPKPFTVHKGLR